MIGKLRGKVDAIGEAHCIIDVNGVGYEVQASARTLRNLRLGADVALTIDTHVREDAIRLYGFSSEIERSWFRTLQNVQGVGAKVALAILGVLSATELASAIALGNSGLVERAPGVGKKLAQRIVIELKDKAPPLSLADVGAKSMPDPAGAGSATDPRMDGSLAAAEAISALTNLGYNPAQAGQSVAAALRELGSDADTASLIRHGLKALAR